MPSPYDCDHTKLLCPARENMRAEIERLRKIISDIAEFCSGDDRTLGAIERLAHIQNTAYRATLVPIGDPDEG